MFVDSESIAVVELDSVDLLEPHAALVVAASALIAVEGYLSGSVPCTVVPTSSVQSVPLSYSVRVHPAAHPEAPRFAPSWPANAATVVLVPL